MFLKFQPPIKEGKERQLNVTWQGQRSLRRSSCGKILDHDEKIAFVVQTF